MTFIEDHSKILKITTTDGNIIHISKTQRVGQK